jgi:ABC-type multidrug transport system ATPase subunit
MPGIATSLKSRSIYKARVSEVLELMDLTWCKSRTIGERPSVRGTLGGELRRLSIAVEIVTLPSIIVLDDPIRDLDPAVGVHVFSRLRLLAERGYTVIVAIPKPTPQVFGAIDSVVLLSNGYSLFASEKENIRSYFSSPGLNYEITEQTNTVDFLLNVSRGRVLPRGVEARMEPARLHDLFEKSPLLVKLDVTIPRVNLLPDTFVKYYGYFQGGGPLVILYRAAVVMERAFLTKLKETEILRKAWSANVVIALLIGYFGFQTGEFGDYASAMFLPYNEALNCTSLLFITSAFLIAQQITNVHTVCQKMRVFRYEQKANCIHPISMCIATATSEATFATFFSIVFTSILFFMTKLNDLEHMSYFTSLVCMMTWVGTGFSTMLAAVLRSEIVVRDVFVFFLFSCIMLSGFPFQLSAMTENAANVAQVNPMRWCFEALMVWKFNNYIDGEKFLTPYMFQSFEKDNVFRIFLNFIIFTNLVFLVTMAAPPNTLTRRLKVLSAPAASAALPSQQSQGDQRQSGKEEEEVPTPLTKDSSMSDGVVKIASIASSLGIYDESLNVGPLVTFEDLNYSIKDKKSPMGFRTILNNTSGRFENGKLGAIMGSTESGKSTLLSLLAGNPSASNAVMTGSIKLNGMGYDVTAKPWQRCAYVEAVDMLYRDLTVEETVTFSAKLRCSTVLGLQASGENTRVTMNLMHLDGYARASVLTLF